MEVVLLKDFLYEFFDEPGIVLFWVILGVVAAFPIIYFEVALIGTLSSVGFGLAIAAIACSAVLRSLRPSWKYFLGPLYYIVFLAIIFRTFGSEMPLWAYILAFVFLAAEVTILMFDFVVDNSSAYDVAEKFRRKPHCATKTKKIGESNMSNKIEAPSDVHRSVRPFVVVIIIIVGIIACIFSYTTGKNVGIDIGYNLGYEAGDENGYSSGYQAGYDSGYAEGEDYGYDRGYDAGHDSGVADSYTPSTYSYETYIGNANSYKFHRESCSYLPADWNQVFFYSREDAVNAGYDPCQKCNP